MRDEKRHSQKEQSQEGANPWFPQEDVDCQRQKGSFAAQAKRPQGFNLIKGSLPLMPKRFSLTKKERLLKSEQIRPVFNSGKRLSCKGLLAIFKGNSLGINRVGFIVPKSSAGLSSTRNRTKRLLREAYRLNKAGLASGFDIILYANKPLKAFPEAENLLMSVLKAAKILKSV